MDPGPELTCAKAGGTKDRISILCLKMLHVFKTKISVFLVMALAKGKRTAFLSSAMDSIRHLDFFH
jgi:hypothetical protein